MPVKISHNRTNLTFFLGKGGVGKTTVSTAYALHRAARRGANVVLVSTDPAHSLGDVLDLKLRPGMQALRHSGAGRLSVWQVDAAGRFEEFLDLYREPITELVEQGTFLSRHEIELFLETALPGLAEISALLTLSDLLESGKFDEIVVDTAPIGHTLQLFRIPTQLARFLQFLELSGRRDQVLAEHFGGTVAPARPKVLDDWDEVLSSLRRALSSQQSKLIMVTSAEKFSLEEASRTARIIEQDIEGEIREVVLNRVIAHKTACKRCQHRFLLHLSACKFLARRFPKAKLRMGEDSGAPIIGAGNLLAFGEHLFAQKALRLKLARPKGMNPIRVAACEWPVVQTQLTLTLGKGGVGKTTVSGGLAYRYRRSHAGTDLLICSTDPAPSLDDLFEQDVGAEPGPVLGDRRFQAVEIDSTAEYLAWSRKVKRVINDSLHLQHGGVHVELSFEHEMISALLDIVPPGVDEIFAVFKLLDLLASRAPTLVLDMAPTGHALELLRTPERLLVWMRLLLKSLAAHRQLPMAQELAVEVASISQRARELGALLKDGKRTSVFVVLLAEPLPDRQTGRLLAMLGEMGFKASALFVNRMVSPASQCPRCRLAYGWQMATLSRIHSSKLRCYGIPDFSRQIAGADGLKRLTARLWQLGHGGEHDMQQEGTGSR